VSPRIRHFQRCQNPGYPRAIAVAAPQRLYRMCGSIIDLPDLDIVQYYGIVHPWPCRVSIKAQRVPVRVLAV
jgi:hypothetical protein